VGSLAAILAAVGIFLPLWLRRDLLAGMDRTLKSRAAQISLGLRDVGSDPQESVGAQLAAAAGRETAVQLLSADGAVVASSGEEVAQLPMIDADLLGRALNGSRVKATLPFGADREPFRVLAVVSSPRRQVLLVAESLDQLNGSVHSLLVVLVLLGPTALVAAGAGGWWLARKALLPVAQMTEQAATIGLEQLHARVPVPRTSDELGRLALTLNAMLDRLERGVNRERRFLADASHELRTPLAIMRSELEVSLRSRRLSGEARDVLLSATEEVERMSRIVDNLLTLARIDEGRLELDKAEVDLHSLAGDVVEDLRPLAVARRVEVEVSGDDAVVGADRQRLHLAVRNLVENAVKYSEPGGRVRVSVWGEMREKGLTVTDTGPGIPPEVLPNIFDRFVRVDDARSRDLGGSGLGLAIFREIVEAHGGRVWAESDLGRGSSFSLALPSTPNPETAAPSLAGPGVA
jgi:heavy metal sensor kinase